MHHQCATPASFCAPNPTHPHTARRGVTLFIDPGFTRLAPTLEDLRCARCEFEQQSPVGAFVQLRQLTRLDLSGSLGVTWVSAAA